MIKSCLSEESVNHNSITNRGKSSLPCVATIGTISTPDPKVSLYEVKTSTSGSSKLIACFHDWDTEEAIDGYSFGEMQVLRQKIDDAILMMKNHNPEQLDLF